MIALGETYYTGTNARLELVNHPALGRRVLDVASFTLRAGDTPLHIFNYARRAPSGGQGGQPYDDTALLARHVELELMLNLERESALRTALLPMTFVGDVRLAYHSAEALMKGEPEAGYLLRRGRVRQMGRQYTTSAPVHPAVHLLFEDIEALLPAFAARADEDLTSPTEAVTLVYHDLLYETATSGTRRYSGVLADVSYTDVTAHEVQASARAEEAAPAGLAALVAAKPFQSAFITARGGEALWAWSPVDGRYAQADGLRLPDDLPTLLRLLLP